MSSGAAAENSRFRRRARGRRLATPARPSLGTRGYMAPEQITAPDAAQPSADLYSLSVMFYELLVGVVPQGHWQPPSGRTQRRAARDRQADRARPLEQSACAPAERRRIQPRAGRRHERRLWPADDPALAAEAERHAVPPMGGERQPVAPPPGFRPGPAPGPAPRPQPQPQQPQQAYAPQPVAGPPSQNVFRLFWDGITRNYATGAAAHR
jgi:serine/threonine protein kinase